MNALKNARYEIFAQEIAKGTPQSKAYLAAGFSASNAGSIKANASRLIRQPEVEARIRELLDAGARRAEIKAADIIAMLREDRDRAHDNKQAGPAVRATELLGKTFGMFVDRKEIKAGLSSYDELSYQEIEELRAMLVAMIAEKQKEKQLTAGRDVPNEIISDEMPH